MSTNSTTQMHPTFQLSSLGLRKSKRCKSNRPHLRTTILRCMTYTMLCTNGTDIQQLCWSQTDKRGPYPKAEVQYCIFLPLHNTTYQQFQYPWWTCKAKQTPLLSIIQHPQELSQIHFLILKFENIHSSMQHSLKNPEFIISS